MRTPALLLALSSFLGVAHAAKPAKPAKPAKCWVKGGDASAGAFGLDFLEHLTAEDLAAREVKLAELEARAPNPNPFPNGVVVVHIARPTLDSAKMSTQALIVGDASGAELLRLDGPDEVPNVPPAPMGGALTAAMWWSSWVVPLPPGAGDRWQVHLVDRVKGDKCVFALLDGKVVSLDV